MDGLVADLRHMWPVTTVAFLGSPGRRCVSLSYTYNLGRVAFFFAIVVVVGVLYFTVLGSSDTLGTV